MINEELALGRETMRRQGRRIVVGAAAGASVLTLVVGCGKSNPDIRAGFAHNPIERIDFDFAGGSVDNPDGIQFGGLCLENSPYDPILEHDFTNDGVRQPQPTQLPAHVSFIRTISGLTAKIKPEGVNDNAPVLELTEFDRVDETLQPVNRESANILTGYKCDF